MIYIDSSVKNYTYSPDQLRLLTRDRPAGGHGDPERQALPGASSKAERMAAIGETTAALSHSIKNILQALRGGADVVEMGLNGQQHHPDQQGLAHRRAQPRQDLQPDDEPAGLQQGARAAAGAGQRQLDRERVPGADGAGGQ